MYKENLEKFKELIGIALGVSNNWHLLQRIIGYVLGVLIGFIFWEYVLLDFDFSIDLSYFLLILAIITLGLGFAYSKSFRCVTLLICLGFWGKCGRSYLRAMAFTLIITGPAANLCSNIKEVARVFTCSASLTYNLTQTRFNLMTAPFFNAIVRMKGNVSSVKNIFDEVKHVVEPVEHEIEGSGYYKKYSINKKEIVLNNQIDDENLAQSYEKNYKKTLSNRCKTQLEKGKLKCKNVFAEAYKKCYEKLPALIRTILCWPMKIDFACDIKSKNKGENVCNPDSAVSDNFGEDYISLKNLESKLISNLSGVDLEFEYLNKTQVPGLQTAEQTGKELMNEFQKKKKKFDGLMYILKRILTFIFVKIIAASYVYHKNYLGNIEWDNFYINKYFKKIDDRRKAFNKMTLLPLKKIEATTYVDPTKSKRSKNESSALFVHTLKLFVELITTIIFFIIDRFISEIIVIVNRNARVEYHQDGEHILSIQVNGTGLIAGVLRKTLQGFNINKTVQTILTNEPCLPHAHLLPIRHYIKVSLVYAGIFFLILNEVVVLRLRRVICSYFYPKREKHRIIYLYNKLTKRRKKIFDFMRTEIEEKVKRNLLSCRLNIFVILRVKYPKYFGWLRRLSIARRKCLICNEVEPKFDDNSRPKHYKNCLTRDCLFVHCEECWREIGEICLGCRNLRDQSS